MGVIFIMPPTGTGLLGRSSYYSILRAEQEEINRLKWIESEKAGHDIGIDHAMFLWWSKYQWGWYKSIMGSGSKE